MISIDIGEFAMNKGSSNRFMDTILEEPPRDLKSH